MGGCSSVSAGRSTGFFGERFRGCARREAPPSPRLTKPVATRPGEGNSASGQNDLFSSSSSPFRDTLQNMYLYFRSKPFHMSWTEVVSIQSALRLCTDVFALREHYCLSDACTEAPAQALSISFHG